MNIYTRMLILQCKSGCREKQDNCKNKAPICFGRMYVWCDKKPVRECESNLRCCLASCLIGEIRLLLHFVTTCQF